MADARMRALITWVEGLTFIAQSDSGHALVLDGPAEAGGRNLGVRPMEAVLLGMGACTASDVVAILRKARQTVSDCHIELQATRADKPPRVFTRIHVKYLVAGKSLRPAAVERAVKLSTEKYCSATIMLREAVDISYEHAIIDPVS